MIIATIETKPILGQREGESPHPGVFEMDVKLHESELAQSADAKKLVLKTVATYLASGVMDTGVPPHMWIVRFPEKICRAFSLEPVIDLENATALFGKSVQ